MLRSLLLSSLLLLGAVGLRAQTTLTLATYSLNADTNICHMGLPVTFRGQASWYFYPNSAYSVVYTFGDGSPAVTDNKMTIAVASTDTISATHTFGAPGTYTVKAVIYNNLMQPFDSLSHNYAVGNCYAASGLVYYDCIADHVHDSTELGIGRHLMSFKHNGAPTQYWLDANGAYNIPIFAGDTITKADNFYFTNPGTYQPASMPFPPITGGVANQDMGLFTNLGAAISNMQGNPYMCIGGINVITWTVALGTDPWKVQVVHGDGTPGLYYYSSGTVQDIFVGYSTPGTYDLTLLLYDQNYYGPMMKLHKLVYPDSCKNVPVHLYTDRNGNCINDTTEAGPEVSVGVTAQLRGLGGINFDSAGNGVYMLYPGDTAYPAHTFDYYSDATGFFEYGAAIHLDTLCAFPGISDPNATYNLPYLPQSKFSALYKNGNYCRGDSVQFIAATQTFGLPAGTHFRLCMKYSDGGTDTISRINTADSLNWSFKHVYLTGPYNYCRATLITDSGFVSDTAFYDFNLQNCFAVNVRAYYDENRNCQRDSNEAYISGFTAVSTSNNTVSDNGTGILHYDTYAAIDSLNSIAITGGGQFSRSLNRHFCSWPVFSNPDTIYDLPLVDTLQPQIYITAQTTSFMALLPCMHADDFKADMYLQGNYHPHPYNFAVAWGDGSIDTVTLNELQLSNPQLLLGNKSFANGNYTVRGRIFDSLTGRIAYGYTEFYHLIVNDTCTGIKGRLYTDGNNNCVFNSSDTPLGGMAVSLQQNGSNRYTLTDSNGNYFFSAAVGDVIDSIKVPQQTAAGTLLTCNGAAPAPFTFTGTHPLLDFGYSCGGTAGDVAVYATHYSWQNGLTDTISLYVQSTGCDTAAGTLSLTLAPGMSLLYTSLPGGVISGQQVSWAIDTPAHLPAIVKVAVNAGGIPAGQQLCVNAQWQTATPDANTANNDFMLCDSVLTDIPALYKNAASDSMMNGFMLQDKPILYTINLHDSLADTVQDIIFLDTLSQYLDAATIQPLSATWPYQLSLIGNNVLRVTFPGLTLAGSSDGHFTFMVQPVAGWSGTPAIINTAAVMYNGFYGGHSNSCKMHRQDDTTTGIRNNVPTARTWNAVVYPNPASGSFSVSVQGNPSGEPLSISIADIKGVLLRTLTATGNTTQCSTVGMPPGIYLIRVTGRTHSSVQKLNVQ